MNSANSDIYPGWGIFDGTTPLPAPGSINYHYAVAWMGNTVAPGSSYEVNTLYGVSYPMIVNPGSGKSGDLWIQGGANSGQGFYVPMADATAKKLGVNALDVTTRNGAVNALGTIDNAINITSGYRGEFGAYQNRMEHAARKNANMEENLQSAESLLRDTNIADEMINYSKNNILVQTTQSILANSNASMDNVLNLFN